MMSHDRSSKLACHRRPQVRKKRQDGRMDCRGSDCGAVAESPSAGWRPVKLSLATLVLEAIFLLACAGSWPPASGQCPVNTMTSFERISGVQVKDSSQLSVLYTAPNVSSLQRFGVAGAEPARQLGLIVPMSSHSMSQVGIPITAECNNRCRRNAKCRAFLVNYERQTCYSVELGASSSSGSAVASSSGSGLIKTPTPIQLVASHERTSYFEKVCLNLPAVECERAWVFERVLGFHVHGHDDKLIDGVSSRLRCQEHCLNEREFRCRSGEYDYLSLQCRLSMVDRHLKPTLFRETSANIDYFENQCVPVGSQCDAFDRYEDLDLGRAEIMRSANSSDQCQHFCTQTIKAFICRSFTWNPITGKCYLNSANYQMVGGQERLVQAPGLIYYQRNDCIDLRLDCDTTAMTVNLRTNEPFRGRMYVREDPAACETMGRSSLTSSLTLPFHSSSARCVQRELPSRFSSIVVVQQHPLIQRKSDRYIKLVCDFQTANKTITSTYNVVANPWTSTALINSTSFAPKIRLRITDKFGVDIAGAKLGDELYLRIEADGESVYDMVARSVLAKSGTSDESIMLIDKDGCPTDFRIFPPLKKLNRRTIVGKFDAFKFSSDVVVRFQVDVQFCLHQCPPTSCEHQQQQQQAELGQLGLLNSNAQQLAAASQPAESGAAASAIQQQLQAGRLDGEGAAGPAASFSLPSSPANELPAYYGAQAARQQGPANSPPVGAAEAAQLADQQQVFEQQHQARNSAAGKSESGGKLRHQQPLGSNALDAAPTERSAGAESAHERRRRSTQTGESAAAAGSRHVPLQREIIVEPSSAGLQQPKQVAAKQTPPAKRARAHSDTNRAGPTKSEPERQQVESTGEAASMQQASQDASLLCTTRNSLVLASLLFCTVQFITIALCLLTWMHRRDSTSKRFKFTEMNVIEYPTSDEIDPEQAKYLYQNHCAIFVLESLPIGSEFGFDLVSFQVGDKFKGVKLIPPGVHFIYVSALDKRNNRLGPRTGFYHVFKPKEILIRRWSSADEDFDDTYEPNDEQRQRYETNLLDLDRYLAPYRFSTWLSYSKLVDRITPDFLRQVMPKCNRIRSVPYLVDAGDFKSTDKSQTKPSSSRSKANQNDLLNNLQPHPDTVLNFTDLAVDVKQMKDAETITNNHLNTTHLLVSKYPGESGRQRLLSELQFAFITFLLGHLYECFERWKDLLKLVCLSDPSVVNHRAFYIDLLKIIEYQFEHVPQDLFEDIVDFNNLVRCRLDTLFQNIEDYDDRELAEQAEHLRHYLQGKFGWQFFLMADDEQPVIVEQ